MRGWLTAWRERRQAVRTSRTVLEIYRLVRSLSPDMSEREVYCWVVMNHAGIDLAQAQRVLHRVEASFGVWPPPRAVTLCDIAHYLTCRELSAEAPLASRVRPDIARVIKRHIPSELDAVAARR